MPKARRRSNDRNARRSDHAEDECLSAEVSAGPTGLDIAAHDQHLGRVSTAAALIISEHASALRRLGE